MLLSIGVCVAFPVIDEQVDRSLRKNWEKEPGVNNKRASKFFELLERFSNPRKLSDDKKTKTCPPSCPPYSTSTDCKGCGKKRSY